MTEPLTYRNVGVDIERANEALRRVRGWIAKTRGPGVIGGIGDFGGLLDLGVGGFKDPILVATTDGVGTKLELARILDRHEVVAEDLVNHCVNDALAMGARPLFFLDYFATGELEPGVFERVIGAMAAACQTHECALLGGETAEMPGIYAPGVYDIAGFLVGVVERDELLTKERVREGDLLFGFPSSGLHTNGYTLARAIVAREADRDGLDLTSWLRIPRPALNEETAGSALLQVHRSYLKSIKNLRRASDLHAIAHITGGGWEGNIPRVLPDELGVAVDRSTFKVPRIFTYLAERGGVPEDDQWSTWNMGIGLVAFVAAEDLDRAHEAVPEARHIGHVEAARTGEPRVRFV